MAKTTFAVLITTPSNILFQGTASSMIVPGEEGTFEMLPLHRPLVSRLVDGEITVDDKTFSIRRGAIRIADDIVTAVVEIP